MPPPVLRCRPLPLAAILLVASPPHIVQVNLSILYAALSPPSRIVDPDVHWDTQRSRAVTSSLRPLPPLNPSFFRLFDRLKSELQLEQDMMQAGSK